MIGEKDWVPTKQIRSVLEKIVNMMAHPNIESAINEEACVQYTKDFKKFEQVAREWTRIYAK